MKLGGWLVMLSAMVIFLTIMGIPTGLTSIFNFMGLNISPITSSITSLDTESSTFWDYLFKDGVGILVLLGVAGTILIGLFGKGYDTSLVYAPFIVSMALIYIGLFASVFDYIKLIGVGWMTTLVGFVLALLGIGFLMACADYFGGR